MSGSGKTKKTRRQGGVAGGACNSSTPDNITPEELQKIMAKIKPSWPVPELKDLMGFVYYLNMPREFPVYIRSGELEDFGKKLNDAYSNILSLSEFLPIMVKNGRMQLEKAAKQNVRPYRPQSHQEILERLNDAVADAAKVFRPRPRRPTRYAQWHHEARFILRFAHDAWTAAGVRQVGASSPTSPAVLLAEQLLARRGFTKATPQAIVKMVREDKRP